MVSVNEVPVIGVVVEGKLDQRFIEVYCGNGGIGIGPHHQMVLMPTQTQFKENEDGRLEPVPGTEKPLEPMDLGTVFVFTEAVGRSGGRIWSGPAIGLQLGHDIKVLGKVELTSDSFANGARVRELVDTFGITTAGAGRVGTFHQESHAEYKAKYPERWARDLELARERYGNTEAA